MHSSHLEDLNERQKEAVLTLEGPLLVLAGAGAGKTKTITERIRHLVLTGVNPSSILAITFTNKAAREMRERVERGLSQDKDINRPVSINERPFVSTFHALGVHMLREHSEKVRRRRTFAIFDRDDSKKAVKEALEKKDLDPKTHDPGRILGMISREKGLGRTADEYAEADEVGYFTGIVLEVWAEYEKILERDNALDFDDLLLKTRDLLRSHPETRKRYRETWRYLLIDEYQDTNQVQYEISKMLVGEGENICVVGDIDQNIYSWRGANIRNILNFEKDYPGAKVVILEENYRSTKTILEAANTIIEKNEFRRDKILITSNDKGEKIGLCQALDEASEAEFIASQAQVLISNGLLPEEIAVLYRANFQSRVLEEAFMSRSIPYQIIGTRFFERKEVKDLVSYLRAALNPECLADIKRIINVPARGIGKVTVAKIFAGDESSLPLATRAKVEGFRTLLADIKKVSKEKKPSETIHFIIKESGLEEEWKESGKEESVARLENAYELVNFASRYDHLSPEEGILEFLSDAALQSDQDEMREDQSSVRLLTVHSSKGLEFDAVFIAGLEDGLFPHQRASESDMSPEEAEEERRLFYVALTRARKKVFLCYAQMRTLFGRKQVNMPSEFIYDIPEDLIEEEASSGMDGPHHPLLEIDF